jgi:hypothetical protein
LRSEITGRAFVTPSPASATSATHSTGQPSASEMNAIREPSGEKRGWLAATASLPAIVRTLPSAVRSMTREPSHGMFGRSHSCHASIDPSGDHTGSHA